MGVIKLILGSCAIASCFFFTSCSDNDDDDDEGFVRFMQLSPNAGSVDVLLDGFLTDLENVPFPQGTFYLVLVVGGYTLNIVPHNGDLNDAIINVDIEIDNNENSTVVLFDQVQNAKALILPENTSSLPANQIRARVVHVASAIGAIDVWDITDPNDQVQLYDDLSFGSAGDYLETEQGAYTLGIDSDNDQNFEYTFELPELFAASTTNVFFVSDDNGDVFLVLEFNNNSTTRIDPE